jgi:heptosyltransferase-1
LIVRLGSLGDVVHGLPALVAIKRSFPHWELDWLVERRWLPVLAGNPYLSRVVEFDTLAWRASPFSSSVWSSAGAAVAALRERRYDVALDLQGSLKSAVSCFLSGAPQVVGFDRGWLREPLAGLFYTRRVQTNAVHVIDANIALAGALGALSSAAEFPLPAGDVRSLPQELQTAALAVINPGAGWKAKRWTVAGYAAVCDELQQAFSLVPVLNCGPGEETFARQVQQACRNSTPRIYSGNLPGLIALLRRAAIMVAPDTGPLHLAAALGVPAVALFGPTNPRRNGPYGALHRVLRSGGAVTSHTHSDEPDASMDRITPAEVLLAVHEVLRDHRALNPGQPTKAPHTAAVASPSETL